MKKRTATTFHFDLSYKEAKRLNQCKGASVFKGLATRTNAFDEVRLQFHIVKDSHYQMESAFSVCKEIFTSFGHTLPKLVFTNYPYRDKSFFWSMFSNLKHINVTTTTRNNNGKPSSRDTNISNELIASVQVSMDDWVFFQ